jgi:uridine phosphorylase
MKYKPSFVASHMQADASDLAGNNGIGRYILLPGSDGRAKDIAQHFDNLIVKSHPRGHHLYLGTLTHASDTIDVATIASGMGCPSMEIILHELFHLGGKRFLRIGTAGSLQPDLVRIGDLVNAQAAVRDEKTTADYAPVGMPAVASFEMISAIARAAKKNPSAYALHRGTVHCKSSLYAGEFGCGPNAEFNQAYLDLLTRCGVLASEMETSALFIQSQYYHHQLMQEGNGPAYRVFAGAILGVVSISDHHIASPQQEEMLKKNLIELALETVKVLYAQESNIETF